MTNQEAYDTIKKHLLCQRKRSVDDKGRCKFRGVDGLKCAVGALIPDDKYDPRWDLYSNFDAVYSACELFHLSRSMMSALVSTHDTMPIELWESRLKIIAERYGLTP